MWENVTVSINGQSQKLKAYKQQHNESCGPSSILILIYVLERHESSEAVMRLWCSQAERAMQKSGGAPGSGKHVAKDARIFDFSGGARGQILVDVLKSRKPTYYPAYRTSDEEVSSHVGDCGVYSPGILRVQWDGTAGAPGGAHFTVCLGTDGGGNRIFLDPWYGLVSNTVASFPRYNASGGSFRAGDGEGTFTHLINTKSGVFGPGF
jgi:hypothetical protein